MSDTNETEKSTALVKPENLPVQMASVETYTPAMARVEAVANVLHKAYEKASLLELTGEQVKALKLDFPNEAFKLGAGGNPDLIYIEHAYLRDRFDEVIGMGQWALIRSRPHWAEEFVTNKGQKAVRIYADCALLIKGCLVSEAIGEMVYYPNNPTQSYGDAAEGSETAAFRRCAKKIGVGLQAWKKDFCSSWMAWNSEKMKAKYAPKKTITVESKPAGKAKEGANFDNWLENCKAKLMKLLEPNLANSWAYFVREGFILPNEKLEAVTATKLFPKLSRINVSNEELIALNKKAVADRHQEIMDGIQKLTDAEPDPELQAKFSEVYAIDPSETESNPGSPRSEDFPPEPDPDEGPQEEHLGDGSPEEPSDKGETRTKMGEIVAIAVKHGTSSRGKWTCYGIKIGDDWFNTFDTKLGKQLEKLKNKYVTISYEKTERGNTALQLMK